MLLLPAKKNARETPVCFSRKTTNSSKANIFFRGNPVKNWRDVCPSSLTIKKARAPIGVNVMFHFHEKSVDGNCAVRSSRIPYFLARKLFYTTAFPSLSAVIAGRETSGAGMPKDFYSATTPALFSLHPDLRGFFFLTQRHSARNNI